MPNRNAIIAPVVRITPAVTKRGLEMLREAPPEGFSIEFHGNQNARLSRDERGAGMVEILEELRKMGAPVFVEVHPESKTISRLLIPLVTKVAGLSETKEGGVQVKLELSSARHMLARTNPDFEEIQKALRDAVERKIVAIVTESDAHEIIDVRPFPADLKLPALPVPPLTPTPPKGKKLLGFFWLWPWFCPNSITEQTALAMFNLMSGKTCDPLTVPAPCIPFLYPDDGCWARAHEMYRLMMLQGVTSKKVWIYGSLNVSTKNNPSCQVFWGWHVAPTVCVRGSGWLGWLFRREKVIDPSLFPGGPVSKEMWKSVQGDSNAQLVSTDGTVYHRSYGGVIQTDPAYSGTNYYLAYYRLQLKNRSLQFGPPPYANCA